jgi:hypothetical protein
MVWENLSWDGGYGAKMFSFVGFVGFGGFGGCSVRLNNM